MDAVVPIRRWLDEGLPLPDAAAETVPKQKFNYTSFGSVVHAQRCLSKKERDAISKIVGELRTLDPSKQDNQDRVKELMKEISAQPVKFVPIKREVRIDTAKKYPYRSTKRGG